MPSQRHTTNISTDTFSMEDGEGSGFSSGSPKPIEGGPPGACLAPAGSLNVLVILLPVRVDSRIRASDASAIRSVPSTGTDVTLFALPAPDTEPDLVRLFGDPTKGYARR